MPDEMLKVAAVSLASQQNYDGVAFPAVLACQSSDATLAATQKWIADNRVSLEQQLVTVGTILFRGFPLATAEDFDIFIQAFELENFAYKDSLSNAVRTNFTERVFSANEAPAGK